MVWPRARNYLGFVAWLRGDCAAAELLCALALQEFRRTGSLENVAGTLINLGAAALYSGNNDRATTRLEEALGISRRLGFPEGIAWSSHELAIVARRERRSESESAQMLRDALLVHHQLGDRWRLASVLEEIAGTLLVRRDAAQAAALLSCVASMRGQVGVPVPPAELPDREAAMARAQRKLGQRAYATATAQGAGWNLDRAVDTALEAIDELVSERGPGERQMAPILTSRELAGARARRRRAHQPRDRQRALHQPEHRRRARLQHPAQARGQAPRRRRGSGAQARAAGGQLALAPRGRWRALAAAWARAGAGDRVTALTVGRSGAWRRAPRKGQPGNSSRPGGEFACLAALIGMTTPRRTTQPPNLQLLPSIGQKCPVEIDGFAVHGHRGAFERDRQRDQRLIAAGFRIMRITWRQLTGQPMLVVANLART